MEDFKLWLEFEEVEPGAWNKENDFAKYSCWLIRRQALWNKCLNL